LAGCKWSFARFLSIFDRKNFKVVGVLENLGDDNPIEGSGEITACTGRRKRHYSQ